MSLYHVTYTRSIPSIMKDGLRIRQTSNWVKGGKRYGNGEIYAMENQDDAIRWAGKMDWEFNRSMGTGKISIIIITLEQGDQLWKVDSSDPLSQSGNRGKWMKCDTSIPPQQITGSFPVTSDLIREACSFKQAALEDSDISDDSNNLPSLQSLQELRPELLHIVQEVYDRWDPDEDGLCHEIAASWSHELKFKHHIESKLRSNGLHTWVIIPCQEGNVKIDIPFEKYEEFTLFPENKNVANPKATDGWFDKREGVVFSPEDLVIKQASRKNPPLATRPEFEPMSNGWDDDLDELFTSGELVRKGCRWLYHGTSSEVLKDIKRNGLNKDANYITVILSIAQDEAKSTCEATGWKPGIGKAGGEPIVVVFDAQKLLDHDWYPDREYGNLEPIEGEMPDAFWTDKTIPPSAIVDVLTASSDMGEKYINSIKQGSRKNTPLSTRPEFEPMSNGWALDPDNRQDENEILPLEEMNPTLFKEGSSDRFSPDDPMTREERHNWFVRTVQENVKKREEELRPQREAEIQAITELGDQATPSSVAARVMELLGVEYPSLVNSYESLEDSISEEWKELWRSKNASEEDRYSLFYVTMQDQGRTMSVPMLQPTSMTGTLPEITEWARDSEKNPFTSKYFALYAFPTEGGKVLAWISPNFKESDEGNTVSTAEGIRLEMKNKRSKTASEEERYTLYYATALGQGTEIHRNAQLMATEQTGTLLEVTDWAYDNALKGYGRGFILAAFPTEGGKILQWNDSDHGFLDTSHAISTAEGIRLELNNKKGHPDDRLFIPYSEKAKKKASEDDWKAQSSGVVPICSETKRICLAWRSEKVEEGNCWGTLGGAVKKDMSPEESARTELQEETGYSGPIETHAAFVFKKDDFTYSNFIGVVDEEFAFQPTFGHEWENDSIEWFTLEEIEQDIKDNPKDYHPGIVTLFEESKDLIHGLVDKQVKTAAEEEWYDDSPMKQPPPPSTDSVVYHGSIEKFVPTILSEGLKSTRGIYTSPNKELALRWGTQRVKESLDWDPELMTSDTKVPLFTINAKGLEFREGASHDIWVTKDTVVPKDRLVQVEMYRLGDLPQFPLSSTEHIGAKPVSVTKIAGELRDSEVMRNDPPEEPLTPEDDTVYALCFNGRNPGTVFTSGFSGTIGQITEYIREFERTTYTEYCDQQQLELTDNSSEFPSHFTNDQREMCGMFGTQTAIGIPVEGGSVQECRWSSRGSWRFFPSDTEVTASEGIKIEGMNANFVGKQIHLPKFRLNGSDEEEKYSLLFTARAVELLGVTDGISTGFSGSLEAIKQWLDDFDKTTFNKYLNEDTLAHDQEELCNYYAEGLNPAIVPTEGGRIYTGTFSGERSPMTRRQGQYGTWRLEPSFLEVSASEGIKIDALNSLAVGRILKCPKIKTTKKASEEPEIYALYFRYYFGSYGASAGTLVSSGVNGTSAQIREWLENFERTTNAEYNVWMESMNNGDNDEEYPKNFTEEQRSLIDYYHDYGVIAVPVEGGQVLEGQFQGGRGWDADTQQIVENSSVDWKLNPIDDEYVSTSDGIKLEGMNIFVGRKTKMPTFIRKKASDSREGIENCQECEDTFSSPVGDSIYSLYFERNIRHIITSGISGTLQELEERLNELDSKNSRTVTYAGSDTERSEESRDGQILGRLYMRYYDPIGIPNDGGKVYQFSYKSLGWESVESDWFVSVPTAIKLEGMNIFVGKSIECKHPGWRLTQWPPKKKNLVASPVDDHEYLFRGLPVTVEKWKGERRHNRILQADYGFIPDTIGKGDGEAVDVYVGENEHAPYAYVVEQLKEDGSFDEYKVLLGFESLPEAEAVYLAQFDPGWRETRVQAIHEVPVEEFLDVAEDKREEEPNKTAADEGTVDSSDQTTRDMEERWNRGSQSEIVGKIGEFQVECQKEIHTRYRISTPEGTVGFVSGDEYLDNFCIVMTTFYSKFRGRDIPYLVYKWLLTKYKYVVSDTTQTKGSIGIWRKLFQDMSVKIFITLDDYVEEDSPELEDFEGAYGHPGSHLVATLNHKTAASHREWWPYGRHKFVPQEGSPECKACELPADHILHTTPPPEKTAANPAPWAENLEGDTPMSEPRLDTIWVWHPDMGVHTSEGTDHTNLLQSIGWGAYGIAYDKIYRGYAAVYPDQKMVKVYRASSSSDEIPEDVWKEYKSLYPGFKVLTQDTGFDPKMGALHLEAEVNYDEMFAGLTSLVNTLGDKQFDSIFPRLFRDIQNAIGWSKTYLKKNYRIVWYLRWAKLYFIEQTINKINPSKHSDSLGQYPSNEESNSIKQQLNSLLSKEIGRFNAGAQKAGRHSITAKDINDDINHNQLKHFFDMRQVDKIQEYPLDFQTIPEVLDTFRAFEQEYSNQMKEEKRWVPPTSNEEGDLQGEVIVKFPNGWVWWDLGTNYDENEAESMGHCATCGENATLVSLREPRDNKDGTRSWRPHLTFELDEDGSLRQMKGVSNSKPKPEYHSYILALLTATKRVESKSKKTEPIVKSIKGSSYKREADFALKDLTPEDLETLYAARPDLMPIDIYVQKHGVTRDLMVQVEGELKGVGYPSKWNGSKKSPLFEIEAWKNLGDLIRDKGNDLAQWAWKITNGEEYLDYGWNLRGTTNKELWDILPDEMKENVKQILDHKYPQEFKKFLADAQAEAATRRGRIPRENVIDFAEERDEEDLLQAIRSAAQVGEETGTQNEIFKSLKEALEESAFAPKDPKDYYDGPWAENLTLSEAADLINDTSHNSRMDGGDGDLDHRIVMKEPNYGFADFDEKAAVEYFSNEYGIEKKLKEIEPAKVASTKIIEDYETPRLKVQVTGSPQRLFFEGTLKPEAHDWLTKVNFTDKVVVNFTVDLGADGEAYFNRLDSDIRYRGFGPELMKSALGKIAEMGYKHAKTYIENDNYASQAMVKKLGGTEVPDSYNGQGSYYEFNLGVNKTAKIPEYLQTIDKPLSKEYDAVRHIIQWYQDNDVKFLLWRDFQKQFQQFTAKYPAVCSEIRQNRPKITYDDLSDYLTLALDEEPDYGVAYDTYQSEDHSYRDVEQLVLQINQGAKATKILKQDPVLERYISMVRQSSTMSGHPSGELTVGWLRVDFVDQNYLLVDEIQTDLVNSVTQAKSIVECRTFEEFLARQSEQVKTEIVNHADIDANIFNQARRQFLQYGYTAEKLDEIKSKLVEMFKNWADYALSTLIEIARRHDIKNVAIHTVDSIANRDESVDPAKIKMYYDHLAKSFGFKQQEIDEGELHGKFWVRKIAAEESEKYSLFHIDRGYAKSMNSSTPLRPTGVVGTLEELVLRSSSWNISVYHRWVAVPTEGGKVLIFNPNSEIFEDSNYTVSTAAGVRLEVGNTRWGDKNAAEESEKYSLFTASFETIRRKEELNSSTMLHPIGKIGTIDELTNWAIDVCCNVDSRRMLYINFCYIAIPTEGGKALIFNPESQDFEESNYTVSTVTGVRLEVASIKLMNKTAAVDDDDDTLAELDKLYPKLLGDTCGSLKVRGTIPNLSSIESSLGEDYIELPGIRVVQLQSSKQVQQGPQQQGPLSYSSSEERRIRRLAEEINESREINPLIVVIEGKDLEEDLYILEGGHRFDALRLLGIKEFPAVVVLEK